MRDLDKSEIDKGVTKNYVWQLIEDNLLTKRK